MKHNENYSQIAPHAVEQSLVIKHINERFASWKTSIHDIQDLLKEVEILEKELDKAYANTLKKLDNKDEEFGQSVSQIFQPLKDYSIQMHSMFESVQSKNEVQVTKRLKLLKQQLSSRTNEFSKALQKAQHNIELARENAKREMIKYEKEDMSRKRDHIAPSHPHSQTDPWLDSKYVWDKINLLINEENVYQESMRHLFTEIGAYDNQIAEELNLILVEHNILRKEQMSLFLVIIVNLAKLKT